MILTNKYIFSTELTQKSKMHTANISMARNQLIHNGNESAIVKLGLYNFIDKTANLPNYISSKITEHTFVSMENLMPKQYFKKHYKLKEEDIQNLLLNKTVVVETKIIQNVEFLEFSQEICDVLLNTTTTITNKKMLLDSLEYIKGYTKLGKNTYLMWY